MNPFFPLITITLCLALAPAIPAQTSTNADADFLLKRAERVLESENDLHAAVLLYKKATAHRDAEPTTRDQAWLGLGRCLRALGEDKTASTAFQRAAEGESDAAKRARAILAGAPDEQDERLASRINRAITKLLTVGAGQNHQVWKNAQKELIFIGKPAIKPLAFQIKSNTTSPAALTNLVWTVALIGGEPAREFLNSVRSGSDLFLRRAVISALGGAPVSQFGMDPAVQVEISKFVLDEDALVRHKAFDFLTNQPTFTLDASVATAIMKKGKSETQKRFLRDIFGRQYQWLKQTVLPLEGNAAATFGQAYESCLISDDMSVKKIAFESMVNRHELMESPVFRRLCLNTLAREGKSSSGESLLGVRNQNISGLSRYLGKGRLVSPGEYLEIAEELGPFEGLERNHYQGSYQSGQPLPVVISYWVKSALETGWGAESAATVMKIVDLGYYPRDRRSLQALDRWLAKNDAAKHPDLLMRAVKVMGYEVENVIKAISPMSKSLVEQAKEVLLAMPAERLDREIYGEAYGILRMLCSTPTKPSVEALAEIIDHSPKSHLKVAQSLSSAWSENHDLLTRLLAAGDQGRPSRLARNEIFGYLLTKGSPAVLASMVDVYESGIDGRSYQSYEDFKADPEFAGSKTRGVPRGLAQIGIYLKQNVTREAQMFDNVNLIKPLIERCLSKYPAQTWDDLSLGLSEPRWQYQGSSSWSKRPFHSEILAAIISRLSKAPSQMQLVLAQKLIAQNATYTLKPETLRPLITIGLESNDQQLKNRCASLAAGTGLEHFREIFAKHLDDQINSSTVADLIVGWPANDIEGLTELLQNKTPEVRVLALKRLVNLKGESAWMQVRAHLEDPAPDVRAAAASLSIRFDNEEVPKEVLKRLKDADSRVRAAASSTMTKLQEYRETKERWEKWTQGTGIDATSALDALVAQVRKDSPKEVRMLAIQSLATFGKPEVLPVLINLVLDEDKLIADTARRTIEKINAKN